MKRKGVLPIRGFAGIVRKLGQNSNVPRRRQGSCSCSDGNPKRREAIQSEALATVVFGKSLGIDFVRMEETVVDWIDFEARRK